MPSSSSSCNYRPPRRTSSSFLDQNTNTKRSSSSSTHNDPLFKLLLFLVVVVGLVNIIIFASVNNATPQMQHLPTSLMQQQQRLSSDSVKNNQSRGANDMKEKVNGEKSKITNHEIQKTNKHAATDTADTNDKDRIIQLLQNAGVELTPSIISTLPTWSSVVAQYGSEPVIVGLDTCGTFRNSIDQAEAYVSTAGMFNTGTNLLSELMSQNCYLPQKTAKYGQGHSGMRWQVPWGKHSPASWRTKHRAPAPWAQSVDISTIFPVVTIKDPYHWMGSMCRKHYEALWPHTKNNCPNLIRQLDDSLSTVNVVYRPENVTTHTTLVGLWNDYNNLYVEADFPRLIVRYEDLLFHPEYVVSTVCECAGGLIKEETIKHIKGNAKGEQIAHQGANNLLGAIVRYGSVERRAEGFSERDKALAESRLNRNLIDMFGYKVESKLTP